jgi:hypothetical protein
MGIVKTTIMTIAATATIALLATTASAAVLTFDRASACAGPCVNYAAISQSYGDTAFMDVSYSARADFGNTALISSDAYFWDNGYGDLTDVVYGGFGNSDVLEITFTALNGTALKLNSFDSAGYPNVNRDTSVRFYDLSYNLLDGFDFVAPGTGRFSYSCADCTITGGFIIQLGPDGYNVGLDNINVTAVPEPGSWAMMIAGFGLTGAALRRRRAVVA